MGLEKAVGEKPVEHKGQNQSTIGAQFVLGKHGNRASYKEEAEDQAKDKGCQAGGFNVADDSTDQNEDCIDKYDKRHKLNPLG